MEYTKVNTCGCKVETDKHLNTLWLYCPKHKAAPDMYEACKTMLDRYTALVNSGDAGNWNPEEEDEVKMARAAIAKAEGK